MTEHNSKTVKLFTVGYAGKSAEEFFTQLLKADIRKVVDVRLYNTSRLAGYTKKTDLRYFLKTITAAEYVHVPIMAPTKELLSGYKNGSISWPQYETRFNELIAKRKIERHINPNDLHMACLLCAEAKPDNCHRRLIAEYFAKLIPGITIHHL